MAESEDEFKQRKKTMAGTYNRFHFRAQRGVGETQEQFDMRKATKLFEVRVAILPVLWELTNILGQAIYHFVCERSPNKQRRTHLVKLDLYTSPLKPKSKTAYSLFKEDHPDKPGAVVGEDGKKTLIGKWNAAAREAFAQLPDDEIQRLEDEADAINAAGEVAESEGAMNEAIRGS